MTNPQPGWYSDPSNSSQLRWWDGTQWTTYTRAANGASTGAAPTPSVTTSSSAYSAVPASPTPSSAGSAQRPSPTPAPLSQAAQAPTYTGSAQTQQTGSAQPAYPASTQGYSGTGSAQAGYVPTAQRGYVPAAQPAYTAGGMPPAPAQKMAPAAPARPKKPSAWTRKQKGLTVLFTLLSVIFIVLGFSFIGAAERNTDRASTIDTKIQPLRKSVADQEKKLESLKKQLEGAGK